MMMTTMKMMMMTMTVNYTFHLCSSIKISDIAISALFHINARLSWSAAEAYLAKNKNIKTIISWPKLKSNDVIKARGETLKIKKTLLLKHATWTCMLTNANTHKERNKKLTWREQSSRADNSMRNILYPELLNSTDKSVDSNNSILGRGLTYLSLYSIRSCLWES